jgi:signal transduction histidine kinase
LAISQVGVTIELLRVDVRELVDLDVRLRQGSGELGSLRAQLDALHRNIQVVAQREAAAASRQATLGIQPAASLALIGAVLLVVAIAGVVILRWSFRLRSAAVELDQETRRRRAAEVDRAQLLERLVTAHEEERSRISRELHDEMGQKLSALIFGLDRIVGDSPRDDRGARDLGALRDVAGGLLDDVHAVAFQLRPPALTDLGLHGALSGLVDAWRTQCEVAIDLFCEIDTRLSPVVETTLFRVVQEALTNIRKHAGASSVSVLVRRNGEGIRLVVDDDGRGFSPDEGQSPEKLGLRGMRERVQTVGGSLEFESIPGKGTSVVVSIPVVS